MFNCIDDDCDGVIDEGAPGLGASCNVGQGIGQCRFGTRQCVGGHQLCGKSAHSEVCNGEDDDCDGEDDEDAEDKQL